MAVSSTGPGSLEATGEGVDVDGTTEVLVEALEFVRDALYPAVQGLTIDDLTYRPGAHANSIAWLAWHLTRLQDETIARLASAEEVWTAGGWYERFGLPFTPTDTGLGHDAVQVGAVRAGGVLLLGYFEDVHQGSVAFVRSAGNEALGQVVDSAHPRPVTAALTIMRAVGEDLQHVGQAAYIRGLRESS